MTELFGIDDSTRERSLRREARRRILRGRRVVFRVCVTGITVAMATGVADVLKLRRDATYAVIVVGGLVATVLLGCRDRKAEQRELRNLLRATGRRCEECGYDVQKISSQRCPECGHPLM